MAAQSAVLISCASCEAALKVPSPTPGKALACPKCRHAFRLELGLAPPEPPRPAPPRPAALSPSWPARTAAGLGLAAVVLLSGWLGLRDLRSPRPYAPDATAQLRDHYLACHPQHPPAANDPRAGDPSAGTSGHDATRQTDPPSRTFTLEQIRQFRPNLESFPGAQRPFDVNANDGDRFDPRMNE